MALRSLWTIYAGLWRRTRATFLVALAGAAIAYVGLWLADEQGLRSGRRDESDDFMIAMLVIGMSGLVAAAGVLLSNSDAERLSLALPDRVLRMPLRTWKLVLVHLVFGISVTGLVTLCATLAAPLVLEVELAWWAPAVGTAVLIPLVQLWAFATGNAGWRPALTSFVVYFGGLAALVRRPWVSEFFQGASPLLMAGMLGSILIASFVLVCAVVRVQRRGGWEASLPRRGAAALGIRTRRAFRSPRAAQFWFEWRQYGTLLPVYVGGVAAAYFLGMPLVVGLFRMTDVTGKSSGEPLFRIDWFTSAQYIWMGLFLAALVGSVLTGGVMFMRGGHWNSASSYLLTRPLALARISNARLLVLGVSATVAVSELAAITLAIEGVVYLLGESTGFGFFLRQGYEQLPMWLTTSMHYGFLLVLMWAFAWPIGFVFAIGVFAIFVLPVLAVQWAGVLLGAWELETAESKFGAVLPYANWAAAAIVVAGLLAFAWAAGRRRLVHPIVPLLCVGLWLIYSWAFAHFMTRWEVPAGVQEWYVRFPHPVNWPLWMAISIVPLLPFFLHPLMMERIRHR